MQMLAEIWIGGNVTPDSLKLLYHAIKKDCVRVASRNDIFKPGLAHDLLSARGEGGNTLHLWAPDARYGQFDYLESFLQRQQIAFDRRNRYKTGIYYGTMLHYRPGMAAPIMYGVDERGRALVPALDVTLVADLIADGDPIDNILKCMGIPEFAPLEPFTIGEEPEPQEVFFDGEREQAISAIEATVIGNPITVERIIEIIQVSGKLASHGVKAEQELSARLKGPLTPDVVVVQVSQGQVSCVYCDDPDIPVRVVNWDTRGHGTPPTTTEPDRHLLGDALLSLRKAVAESL